MYMFKYVTKRLGLMLCTFFIIFTMCFVLIKLLPIPVNILPGMDTEIAYRTLEGRGWITNIREGANGVWEYDRVPILSQYANYLKRIVLDGDFGIATTLPGFANKDVWNDVFIPKLPPTILINIYSTLIGVPIGLALGIIAALKKNKWQDQVINVFIMLFISVPSFVYAFLLQYFIGFKLGLCPLVMESGTDYFTWTMFHSAIMPILALSFGTIAGDMRLVRAELTETLTTDYMLLARTKGLTRKQATFRHAFRNSLVPLMPTFMADVIYVISGSMIIEQIFAVPGIGKTYLLSISMRDYSVFMAISMFYVIIGLVAGIIFDLSYGFIDPRIRMGGGKNNELS